MHNLYEIAERKRQEWQLACVVNGTNLDDLGDYRPGLEAAKLAGVRSPFVELGFQNILFDAPQPHDEETLERFIGEVKPMLAARLPAAV